MPDETPTRPDGLPDLSLYSTPDLAMHLLAELEIRHQNDVLIFVIKRDVDGNRPAEFTRIVGDEDRVAGLAGSVYRHIKRTNDRIAGRWTGHLSKKGWSVPGEVEGGGE